MGRTHHGGVGEWRYSRGVVWESNWTLITKKLRIWDVDNVFQVFSGESGMERL